MCLHYYMVTNLAQPVANESAWLSAILLNLVAATLITLK